MEYRLLLVAVLANAFENITKLCMDKPIPLPSKLVTKIFFLPITSDSFGHVNNPNNIPSGYALVSDPNDAPVGKLKCVPNEGVSGDVIVKPSKLRVVAVKIATMANDCDFDAGVFFLDEVEDGDDDADDDNLVLLRGL
mmetsp:Transcript_17990/g.20799  ORF Transcript_17990/g.20799 Transcript_17990/m.20799 type:complete len:138 (-) Transcript_17990:530-943(-)